MADWPHSPAHRLGQAGAYMVTAGTYGKQPLFRSPQRLRLLCSTLFELADKYGWRLQAWAAFPNHYHFVALSPAEAASLRPLVRHLHSVTARALNAQEKTPGRRVWFEYWDSHLTYQKSYFARLNYVHSNAVRHGVVRVASGYPWCSAGWFERRAERAFFRTIINFPCDRLRVPDDYLVDPSTIL